MLLKHKKNIEYFHNILFSTFYRAGSCLVDQKRENVFRKIYFFNIWNAFKKQLENVRLWFKFSAFTLDLQNFNNFNFQKAIPRLVFQMWYEQRKCFVDKILIKEFKSFSVKIYWHKVNKKQSKIPSLEYLCMKTSLIKNFRRLGN